MLALSKVDASINNIPILRDISFTVGPAETVALVGRNGAGKTTLLRTIMGFTTCHGEMRFEGADLRAVGSRGQGAGVHLAHHPIVGRHLRAEVRNGDDPRRTDLLRSPQGRRRARGPRSGRIEGIKDGRVKHDGVQQGGKASFRPASTPKNVTTGPPGGCLRGRPQRCAKASATCGA